MRNVPPRVFVGFMPFMWERDGLVNAASSERRCSYDACTEQKEPEPANWEDRKRLERWLAEEGIYVD